jgi:GcrA cell cycle regulator
MNRYSAETKPWTDERVQQLMTLWNDGLSATLIARTLGHGISRCAVLGKVNRLGLPRREMKRRERVPYKRAAPIKPSWEPAVPPRPDPEPSERIGMLDLRADHCRFSFGHPTDADFGFCGRQKHIGSWCAEHAARVYQPVALRPLRAKSDSVAAKAAEPEAEPDVVQAIGEAA